MDTVERDGPEALIGLTAEQREWLAHSEALWRKARAIASRRPDLDAGDIYHALRALELPPAERLRRGLTRVRVRPHKDVSVMQEAAE